MLEIRVEAPNASSASDLTWLLAEHAKVVEIEGSYWVLIHANHGVASVFSTVRDWVVLQGLETVGVHLDGVRHTISKDGTRQLE